MQSIIIFIILATICSSILSNFLSCAKDNKGNDFTFTQYIKNYKLKNLDIRYIFIFFIIFEILSKYIVFDKIVFYIPLCLALMLAFCLDIKYMIIPDTSSIMILTAGIIKLIFEFSKENVISSITGFLIGGLFFYIINIIFYKITQKTGFGFGDIKLLAALGIFLGYKGILVIIIMSVFLSAAFSIIFLIINAIKKKKREYLPFGPFIVISSLIICIIPATRIISTYFNLIDKIVNKML